MTSSINLLKLVILAGLMAFWFATPASTANYEGGDRVVLILASEDSLLPAIRIMSDSIVAKLRSAIPANLAIFTEFMDVSRDTRNDAAQELSRHLATKYDGKDIDLVIALGPQALQLLCQEHEILFKEVPVIFAGVGATNPILRDLPPRMGGITMEFDIRGTIELAKALQPGLKRLVMVTGATEFDRKWRRAAAAELAGYQGQFEILDLAELPMNRLFDTLSELGSDTAVLYLTIFQDGTGSTFIPRDLTSQIAQVAKAPVYGIYSTYLGQGIVGGYMSSFESQASAAAESALSFLLGQVDPQSLRVVELPAKPHVDWRVMQQWQLEEVALPANSIIHFRAPSLWETHRAMILVVSATLLVQTGMIIALLIQKRRRQLAERSLQQANERMEVIAASANLGLWSWIPITDHVWTTPHCRRMAGLADEAQVDLNHFLLRLTGRKTDAVRAEMLKAINTNNIFQREFRLADDSGNKRWLLATGYCMRHGQQLYMTGTLVDVSERKLAQVEAEQQRQQVIHLTRVATLGELSGALAHELNQPLTAILTNAQTAQRLLSRGSADLSELREILVDIVQDDHRAGAVLKKLRSLIRKEDVGFSAIDLNVIVEEVLDLVHSDLVERQVHVVTNLIEDLPAVRGDPVQIQQVLINLIRNACDAMPTHLAKARQLVVETSRLGNDSLSVTVRDNGIGLPADLHDRVFEPFVTTKSQGMGLGLSICRSILTAHGGKIWCSSNPGGGTMFGFSLPVFEGKAAWAS